MSREPIRFRNSLITKRCLKVILWGISRRFHRLFPRNGQVAHALRTLAPVAINKTRKFHHAAPRLACVKPAASVHPEPGSNSSLYNFLYNSKLVTDTYNSFLIKRCLLIIYAVLDEVSLAYPPDKGRLHTCYSPVRRSPTKVQALSRCPSTCMC